MNEISLIIPNIPEDKKEKRGIVTLLITGFNGLAYEGISSFLHNRKHKALHKAVVVMKKNKVNLQHSKCIHLEDSMFIYGV